MVRFTNLVRILMQYNIFKMGFINKNQLDKNHRYIRHDKDIAEILRSLKENDTSMSDM